MRVVPTVLGKRTLREVYGLNSVRPLHELLGRTVAGPRSRGYATVREENLKNDQPPPPNSAGSSSGESAGSSHKPPASPSSSSFSSTRSSTNTSSSESFLGGPSDWEENPDLSISKFSELPTKNFGVNQHIIINEEFKEALRQILWQFRAPIRYAFAYGSGVFPQNAATSGGSSTLHPNPPQAISNVQKGGQKMIDFIFGVSYTQHWHSLNIQQHRDHYSALASLGSYAVSRVQESIGAGVYFNPYITVNGVLIKYGVINLDMLCKDLSEWNTMYIAGRLQKPVKILRDNPSVRLANQVNLISAVRTALLLLPENFTENDLYSTIAGISYMGDPRMSVGGDDPRKVANIVKHQLPNFRRLYAPLVDNLPNITFNDPNCSNPDWIDDASINAKLQQNMEPETRGHMVRRLPSAFREKLYFEYRSKFQINGREFKKMLEETKDDDPERIRKREGGPFEQKIARDEEGGGLKEEVRQVIQKTIKWPSFTQSLKGVLTAGVARSYRYASEKRAKGKVKAQEEAPKADAPRQEAQTSQEKKES
jgi:mitochondrial translocator assembly and maintenance protein 41